MKLSDITQLVDENIGLNAMRDAKPHVNIVLRGEGKRTVKGTALVDTGAVHSFITPEAVRKLGLERIGNAVIRGVSGKKRMQRYAAALEIPGVGLHVPMFDTGVYANAQPGHRVALIGTDVMAGGDGGDGLKVEWDGPSRKLVLKKSKSRRRRR